MKSHNTTKQRKWSLILASRDKNVYEIVLFLPETTKLSHTFYNLLYNWDRGIITSKAVVEKGC